MENLTLEHPWYLTMKLYPLHSTPSNPCIVTQLTRHIPLAVLFLKYIDVCKGIWRHLHRKTINTVFYSILLQLLGNCKNIFTYARIAWLSIKRIVLFCFSPKGCTIQKRAVIHKARVKPSNTLSAVLFCFGRGEEKPFNGSCKCPCHSEAAITVIYELCQSKL